MGRGMSVSFRLDSQYEPDGWWAIRATDSDTGTDTHLWRCESRERALAVLAKVRELHANGQGYFQWLLDHAGGC